MYKLSIVFLALIVPFHALAATSIADLIRSVTNIVSLLIPLVIGLAILFFFWGIARFILSADNEEKRKQTKHLLIWGVVAMFVLVSIWGIISVLQETLNLPEDSQIKSVNLRDIGR